MPILKPTPKPPTRPLGAPNKAFPKGKAIKAIADQLFPASLGGVFFPVMSVGTSIQHALAEHEHVGINIDDLESMGLKSAVYKLQIPFVNTIYPGKNEAWTAGQLFPQAIRAFLEKWTSGKALRFCHPFLGFRWVKASTIDFELVGTNRTGAIVNCELKETRVRNENQALTAGISTVLDAQALGASLDASTKDLRSLVPSTPVFQETFDSALFKIAGLAGSVTSAAELTLNRPAQMVARLKSLQHSINKARNVTLWPMTDSVVKITDAMQQSSKAPTRATLRYVTPSTMTLAGVLGAIKTGTIADLMKLNPQFLARPAVPAGSVVRYYAP